MSVNWREEEIYQMIQTIARCVTEIGNRIMELESKVKLLEAENVAKQGQ